MGEPLHFVMYLYLAEPAEGLARRYLLDWADSPAFLLWLAYLIAIAPYGATGIRSAERFVQAWSGQ